MAEIRSDNRREQHPKPTQDYERKFTNPGFVDWADFAELEAAYTLEYRKNKYFWIDGDYFECEDDGVTYRRITGGGTGTGNASFVDVRPNASTDTIVVAELSGKTFGAAITATQSFNSDQVSQTGTTLDFSLVGGVQAGILITIFYK